MNRSNHTRWCPLYLVLLSTIVMCFSVSTSWGITVLGKTPETTVVLGLSNSEMEFENPVTSTTTTNGYYILEWEDADYIASLDFDDWYVVWTPGVIDGNANEVWMREVGQKIGATTSKPSFMVSVHLHGDNNDGAAQVWVDGVWRATLDMCSSTPENAWVLVENLAAGTHEIEVWATWETGCGAPDVATYGAAALTPTIPTLTEWGMIVTVAVLLIMGTLVVVRLRGRACGRQCT